MASNTASSSSAAAGSSGSSSDVFRLTSVDDIISLATQCDGDDAKVAQTLAPALHTLAYSQQDPQVGIEVLTQRSASDQDPLQVLAPHQHSLAYLYILATRATKALSMNSITKSLLNTIDSFANCFHTSQVALGGAKITELARVLLALESRQSIDSKWLLQTVFTIFQRFTASRPNNLTTLHPILLNLCIRQGEHRGAYQEVVVHALNDADRNITPLRPVDVIDYFFLAGDVAFAVQDLRLAESLYEACISAPATSAHGRQIEAAKQLIIVQLHREGKIKPLPSYTSSPVARTIARQVQVYTEFARRFSSEDRSITAAQLRSYLQSTPEFEDDKKLPALLAVIDQHRARRIQRLGNSFTRLTIKDIVNVLSLQEAGEDEQTAHKKVAEEIHQLISTRRLNARITEGSPSPIVTFVPDESLQNNFADLQSVQKLNKQMVTLAQWNRLLSEKERDIATSRTYVKRMQSGASSGRGGMNYSMFGAAGGAAHRGGKVDLNQLEGNAGIEDDYNDSAFA